MELNVDGLLELHPALSLTSNNRIKCSITGHEMPAKVEIVKGHINGKKFLRLSKEWRKPDDTIEANRLHIVENKKNEKMLYCNLTGRSIKNEAIHIQRHLLGRRFLKALDHWNECKKTGAEFRTLRAWGSRSRTEKDFYDGQVEDIDDDESDDDMTDLHPFIATEPIEKDSGMNDTDESEDNNKRKRTKKGNEKSVPIPRKREKMDVD